MMRLAFVLPHDLGVMRSFCATRKRPKRRHLNCAGNNTRGIESNEPFHLRPHRPLLRLHLRGNDYFSGAEMSETSFTKGPLTAGQITGLEDIGKPKETDWKSLALEAGNKLAWAVARIKAPSLIFDLNTGESKSWEEDVCETLLKFPGAKIDREALSEKYLNASERRKLAKKKARGEA